MQYITNQGKNNVTFASTYRKILDLGFRSLTALQRARATKQFFTLP